MKKLINKFERDGRRFEIIYNDGKLECCLVKNAGDSIKPSEYLCYAEYEGVEMYQSPALWSMEIAKDEVQLHDALYQRFLAQTDFLRFIGAF